MTYRRKLRPADHVEECQASANLLTSLRSISEVTRLVSEALWMFYSLLTSGLNVLKPPKRDYASRALLYDARMKPCMSIETDPIPSVHEFDKSARYSGDITTTYAAIDERLKSAKALLGELKATSADQAKYVGTETEWKKEIKKLETTCVAIAVAFSQLVKLRDKFGEDQLGKTVECRPEKKYHEWWVVPQLKERT